MTSAITGKGHYEGLGWLCKQISFIYAITGEGKYDGMPIGYTSQLTNKELIDFVVLLTYGKDVYLDLVERVDLFDRYPAAIIRDSIHNGHLLPSMLGTCKYYLYYYKESTKYSEVFPSTFLTTQHDWEKNKNSATNLCIKLKLIVVGRWLCMDFQTSHTRSTTISEQVQSPGNSFTSNRKDETDLFAEPVQPVVKSFPSNSRSHFEDPHAHTFLDHNSMHQSCESCVVAAATVEIPASIRRVPKNLLDRVSQLR
nr:hypothetical protein [Tanacetum cinerariifolium]